MTDVYISINQLEMSLLRHVSFEALGLYHLLKEKATFKTGIVGKFFKQKLNYAWFAREMARPASQGRAALTFDTKAIQRLLAQLAEVGLVEDEHWDGSRLTLRLPYSPIQNKKPESHAGNGKLPQGIPDLSAERAVAEPSPALPVSQSVLISERESIPFFNTGIITDSGDLAGAASLEVQLSTAGALAAKFEATIADAGGAYAHTETSRAFYNAWARQGIDPVQVKNEADLWVVFESEPLTPGALNKILCSSKQQETQRRRRGGVCL